VTTRGKFQIGFPVRYQDTDPRLRATPTALVGIMQEAAILHSEAVGRGIDYLSSRHLSWMIVQTRAKIRRLPLWRSQVEVSTWPSEMGRLLSRREFLLSNRQEQPFLAATTLWAFMNTQERRVTRVPAEVGSAYTVLEERALDGPFRRPAACTKPQAEKSFAIRRWEIDFNEHVNNLRYLDWMLETLPDEIWAGFGICELNIRYQKEAGPAGTVQAYSAEIPSGDRQRRFAHEIRLGDSGESMAVAETAWVRAES
jgi:medium-chain acyl-[acyl-carrier-protein] hydrolase